jgi:predicted Zn-dependent peptidase
MFDFTHVEKHALQGGLVALVDSEVDNDIAALKLHLRAGSRYERDDEAGVSSALMRMLLKGTVRANAEQLAVELESHGIRLYTGVGNENGIVSLVCPLEVFDRALDLMLEVLTTPTFPEEELERDLAVTVGKIRSRLDPPMAHAIDLFDETFYAGHPYHKPAIGYEESVSGLRRHDIEALWRRIFRTAGMVVSVVGRIDTDRVLARLGDRLSVFGGTGLGEEPMPALAGERGGARFVERQTQTACIVAGWPAPPVGHPDSPSMTLLANILGGSLDSRLFTELRDKRGLAYVVGAEYRAYAGPSCLICYMSTQSNQFIEARRGLLEETERLRAAGPTPDELERTRSYMSGAHRLAMERNAHRASSYGLHELFGLGYDYAARYLERLGRVTRDDMLRVAEAWWREPTITAVTSAGTGAVEGAAAGVSLA